MGKLLLSQWAKVRIRQWPAVTRLVIAQAVVQYCLILANARVFIPSAAPVSSILIGWFLRLENVTLVFDESRSRMVFRRHRQFRLPFFPVIRNVFRCCSFLSV